MRLANNRPSGHAVGAMARPAAVTLCMSLIVASLLATQSGCLGLAANLIHAAGGDKAPAAYEGLEESRVAVVTLTENSQFSDDPSARILGRNVTQLLKQQIKDIEIVREDKIANWRDTHGWDQLEFAEIGRGVDADKVLAIEVANLKLRDGATLYRGRADVVITVVDAKTGEQLYRSEMEEFTYPTTAGQYTSETTESRFQKLYLGVLAKRVARQFYPYDPRDDFALDSIVAR
ncbi:hypothetical protein FYK55_09140 [Roseiconus nitratireducens]|uniref:Lipoprotein n=1 Tax=Roseiconus nitratireducens TaxID=2605748 RepID=A0A5M6DA98_9BACT|nr:hypothetical protein [Roseiconus nitratireducens]KAA5544484.1 hypothetical protein FYK55_09140 [Roseiconus nitratireducens]